MNQVWKGNSHEGDTEPAAVRSHGRDLVVVSAGEVGALAVVEAIVRARAGEASLSADVDVTVNLSRTSLKGCS